MPLAYYPPARLASRTQATTAFTQVHPLVPAEQGAQLGISEPRDTILHLPYQTIPDELWGTSGRLVGVCLDCQLLWHLYRLRVNDLDAVVCPVSWVEQFRKIGMPYAVPAYLAGPDQPPPPIPPERARTIDVLVTGNFNPSIHPERAKLLPALARLGRDWVVRFASGIQPDAVRGLLADARIVIRHTDADAVDGLLAEATAAGALTFQNVDGLVTVPELVLARSAVVPFGPTGLPELLYAYLADEELRVRAVRRAQAAGPPFTFWEGMDVAVGGVAQLLPRLRARRDDRSPAARAGRLLARCWQAIASGPLGDPMLVRDLEVTLASDGPSASLHNALGVAVLRQAADEPARVAAASVAAEQFRRAVALAPDHLVARLNLVECLRLTGDTRGIAEEAWRGLAQTDPDPLTPVGWLDDPPAKFDFGYFRASWERTAWERVGDQLAETRDKTALIRWHLQTIRAATTGGLAHAYEAYLASPDLPPANAELGCRLAEAGLSLEAAPYLYRAVEANPFDQESARRLHDCLGRLGEAEALAQFCRDRLLLRRASPGLLRPEPWCEQVPPTDDELVSVIIPCFNLVEFTRLCIESLLQTTHAPYELVVIDNGSTDETPAYLAALRERLGAHRVTVIRNETNRGFPAACNQGIAAARGRFLVFLNNDVVLTPGWLEGLLGALRAFWPSAGAAGPVTNYAPDAQYARPGYEQLDELPAFAARHRNERAGQVLHVPRVTGFCLLTRREVLDRVGAFDERFGIGFFDDDDLCARIREAGWRLLVAADVYVHHFGSRTFRELGVDTRRQLLANLELFKDKWGEDATRGYRLVSLDAPTAESGTEAIPVDRADVPAVRTRPRVALSMIVRNEEHNLGECLRTAADLFDEVVIADTGSTDGTRAIIESFGARLVEFPWIDSFSAARNASLACVTAPWVMWLDADDRLDETNRRRIRQVFEKLGDQPDAFAIRVRSAMDLGQTVFRLLDQVRIFPNRSGVAWEYRIHEQILPSVRQAGGGVRWTDIVVDHTGYQDGSVRERKLRRNLRLLELDAAERPEDPFVLFNLGWTKLDVGQTRESYEHLKASLERSTPDSSIVRKLYDLLGHVSRTLSRPDDELAWVAKGLALFPDDCELLFHHAMILADRKDPGGAARSLEQLLTVRPGRYFGSMDEGARGYRTRHRLAELYRDQGRVIEAEVQWRTALSERSAFAPARLGLGELLLPQRRWSEVTTLADGLERECGDVVNAEVMRCRALAAQSEHGTARARLTSLIERFPNLVGPHVLLTHVLLQQGTDWKAAELALREVLRLDPQHTEANHNLGLLLRHHPELVKA